MEFDYDQLLQKLSGSSQEMCLDQPSSLGTVERPISWRIVCSSSNQDRQIVARVLRGSVRRKKSTPSAT